MSNTAEEYITLYEKLLRELKWLSFHEIILR
jgi:hypothetical protein